MHVEIKVVPPLDSELYDEERQEIENVGYGERKRTLLGTIHNHISSRRVHSVRRREQEKFLREITYVGS